MSGHKKPTQMGSVCGVWMDGNGNFHFSIPDILDAFQLPHNKERERKVEDAICRVLAERFPGARVAYLDHCPHCGVSGWAPHAGRCPYTRWRVDQPVGGNGKQVGEGE